jgi:hypothetical protein
VDGAAKFFSVQVGQGTVEIQHLAEAIFQMAESFSAAAGLLDLSDGRTQTFEDALPHNGARTGHQNVIGMTRDEGQAGHAAI